MYIALYDENRNHVSNLDNATYDLTRRVYDPDSFSAVGQFLPDTFDRSVSDRINAAKVAVVCEDNGDYIYASLIDTVTPEDNTRTIKGLDFKTIFSIDILIDYTQPSSFDGRLSAIFTKVTGLVLNSPDAVIRKIPVLLNIPTDATDTTKIYGTRQDEYIITDAYTFLKGYLKFYEYNVKTRYDEALRQIVIEFVKNDASIDIGLADFIHELQTNSDALNKAVAVIQYKPETYTDDETSEIYALDEDGKRIPVPPRPATLETVFYYRTKENDIVQADAAGAIEGRIYPVRSRTFESKYLAEAQFNAVSELANARYVDNIILDHNKIIDPIDLNALELYTKINIYYNGAFYKTLPVSEKITTADADGVNIKIKLGFKKILLTEIIKR